MHIEMHAEDFMRNNKEAMIKRLNLSTSYSKEKSKQLNNIIPKAIEYLKRKKETSNNYLLIRYLSLTLFRKNE